MLRPSIIAAGSLAAAFFSGFLLAFMSDNVFTWYTPVK
jgi:hypothetical protein